MIIDPFINRRLGKCLYLWIPIIDDETAIKEIMRNAMLVQQQAQLLMNGNMNADEYMQSIEAFVPDIDEYIDEVEENIELYFPGVTDG